MQLIKWRNSSIKYPPQSLPVPLDFLHHPLLFRCINIVSLRPRTKCLPVFQISLFQFVVLFFIPKMYRRFHVNELRHLLRPSMMYTFTRSPIGDHLDNPGSQSPGSRHMESNFVFIPLRLLTAMDSHYPNGSGIICIPQITRAADPSSGEIRINLVISGIHSIRRCSRWSILVLVRLRHDILPLPESVHDQLMISEHNMRMVHARCYHQKRVRNHSCSLVQNAAIKTYGYHVHRTKCYKLPNCQTGCVLSIGEIRFFENSLP